METIAVEVSGHIIRVSAQGNMAWVYAGDVVFNCTVNRKLRMAQFLDRMLADGYRYIGEIEGSLYFRKAT
jgi:hypothetical protein